MICVYEDEGWSGLSVLGDLRPVFDLRCGRRTLLEKLRLLYPGEEFQLQVRDELAELTRERHSGCRVNEPLTGGVFLSGRAIFEKRIAPAGPDAVLVAGEEVVGFRLRSARDSEFESLAGRAAELAVESVQAKVIRYPWELVDANPGELERELAGRSGWAAAGRGRRDAGVMVVGPLTAFRLGRGARVWPGAVISTETGPVLVDQDAQVRPGSFVEGPCYIGPGTVIDGAKVRPGCSFGPGCRIGGEVETSLFQGFANKHHDGFLGHAFVGEWVNLGAGTTNSDLKNAYEPVRVWLDGREIDSGRLKVGCFIGDHAKTAIGTLLNTGAVVGSFANWFESGLSPKAIPRFARGSVERLTPAVALSTARVVMARRGHQPSPAWERVVRHLHRYRDRG